jgi:dUTP pyrophosphatase
MLNLPGVLSREEILDLLKARPPILENLYDAEKQVQPNGVDLTVREICAFNSNGTISVDNKDRVQSGISPLPFDEKGGLYLPQGVYLATCNEIVNLPKNVMALAAPRSSLLRCGVSIQNAVWDAGYSGRSQNLMVVHNSMGFRIYHNASYNQIVFFTLSREASRGYNGIYQNENK